MIERIRINGQDLSPALKEGMVISQSNPSYWRLMLHLGPDDAASGASGLLAGGIGATVEVEVHETRGTVLKGAAVISQFDAMTRYSELTGASRFTRERIPRELRA